MPDDFVSTCCSGLWPPGGGAGQKVRFLRVLTAFTQLDLARDGLEAFPLEPPWSEEEEELRGLRISEDPRKDKICNGEF